MTSMIENLRDTLTQNPAMPFVAYMQNALYAPDNGYYSSNLPKLGRQGDFVTAPEMTPFFGYTVAQQCHEVLATLDNPCVFEFGAGTGQLCVDILTRLEQLDSLPEQYFILEVSGDLQQRQKNLIEGKIPHLAARVQWLARWPEKTFKGVILANEVLDAMPVHRFLKTDHGILESCIQLDDAGNLCERFLPCTNTGLLQYIKDNLPELPVPYLSEVNLLLPGWMQQCHDMLEQGVQFILDYGFSRREYYHPDRKNGTLMCHYQHRAHTNFLANPGTQDITAHVDFTHVAESAHDAGFSVAGYTSQASFLLANNILDMMENFTGNAREKFINTQAVKQLLHPEEMGELFKVIALAKGLDLPLKGFSLMDKRGSL